MDMMTLFVPRGNDIVVTARFPGIADGTGMNSEFWYKNDRTTPDNDPSVITFTSPVVADPANAGSTMSQFSIPATDNAVPGAFWWRVDIMDVLNKRRTVNSGPLLVESV
jgi:hypothetical protein